MKNPFIIIVAIASMLLLYSCSKVIYTNEQVMNGYETKSSVAKKFGAPDEIKTADSTEAWLYKYKSSGSSIDREFKPYPDASTANVVNFTLYKRYVIFNMNRQGNVTSWQCEGVDFKKNKPQPVATAALIVAGVALIVGLLIASANSINFSSPWH